MRRRAPPPRARRAPPRSARCPCARRMRPARNRPSVVPVLIPSTNGSLSTSVFRFTSRCSLWPSPTVISACPRSAETGAPRAAGSARLAGRGRSRCWRRRARSGPRVVSDSPRRRAVRFISATKSGIEPETRARQRHRSVARRISNEEQVATVVTSPARSPISDSPGDRGVLGRRDLVRERRSRRAMVRRHQLRREAIGAPCRRRVREDARRRGFVDQEPVARGEVLGRLRGRASRSGAGRARRRRRAPRKQAFSGAA